ncbi:MAG: response regulator [Flavobacterium sp.]|nr:MAG: response regulator [Flavobacterium sp.]
MDKSKVLFYVDDDEDDRFFFKEATDELGLSVTTFSYGHEMLQRLRTQKPDIIFLDLLMPMLNGDEILKILKNSEEYKDIPVVMISGAFPKKLVRQLYDAGAGYLMKKPTRNSDLKHTIEEIVGIDWNHYRDSA